ncbi:uncharacterized protein LOC108024503 [Drosophila biarmipes]|uniref:uncharacterized protein LOC108024503 n=1 Tax=Drosophila biarmipes TaxID=125945 RepID=UPI0007E87CA6|nr:uncharacterized protein LOC108024503 [Drosophila biarmipes]
MRFLTIIAMLCALAVCVLCADETTHSPGYYWDPYSSSWVPNEDSTTSYPSSAETTTTETATVPPPCDEKIQGPCGNLLKGAQKIYFFY